MRTNYIYREFDLTRKRKSYKFTLSISDKRSAVSYKRSLVGAWVLGCFGLSAKKLRKLRAYSSELIAKIIIAALDRE